MSACSRPRRIFFFLQTHWFLINPRCANPASLKGADGLSRKETTTQASIHFIFSSLSGIDSQAFMGWGSGAPRKVLNGACSVLEQGRRADLSGGGS